MEISASWTGTSLRDFHTVIDWRDTMNYAAALDDDNPCYFNDERPEGVLAPPLYAVALTWPVSEKIWEFIEAENFPVELLATQVHYTEHLHFYRPLAPGVALTIRGNIAAILPHRAGTHVVIRFDGLDEAGERIFTEHIGAMLRGVRCIDGERGREDLPAVPRCDGISGEPCWEETVHVHALFPFLYDGCSRIFFPIHTSRKFARQVGLPGIIVQGTATLALAVREIIRREAGGDPRRLRSLSCRFTGMVLPGTDIIVRLLERKRTQGATELFFAVLDQDCRQAISGGYASLTD
ncbi:MAG: MaoC family dehydratase N-terminal domain-containing protein [Deltaproteobacteria bacterium]|nr:MaoC family dehydratase N-terminal domain-containing protein [Deltaproteobacteria bacterium]